MTVEDYDYITQSEDLFSCRFEVPLEGVDCEKRFKHGLETVTTVVDSFQPLLNPTAIEYVVSDKEKAEANEKSVTDSDGFSAAAITGSVMETAKSANEPHFTLFKFMGSIRISFSDGINYIGKGSKNSGTKYDVEPNDGVPAPLEIEIRQHDVMKPYQTEMIDIRGHSEHWFDGASDSTFMPPATPLAKLDQARLAGALSRLYDVIEPVELSFDVSENQDGLFPPREKIPGYESLQTRHNVEWVLENFEQHRQESSLELAYLGEQIHPLVQSPDDRVQMFLTKAFPDDRYETGTTVTVDYPDRTASLVKNRWGHWEAQSESDP